MLTLVPVAVAVAFAPRGESTTAHGLVWLVFIGSSMHIGATAWFYTVPEVRGFMAEHRGRYVVAPVALVVGAAALAVVLDHAAFTWVLLGFFCWQFFHYQRQNLGVASLAARATGAPALTRVERNAITGCGLGGIAVLAGRPGLLGLRPGVDLGLLVPVGTTVLVVSAVVGLVAVVRRPPGARPPAFITMMLISLAFFAPVVLFDRPFAAVAGLTIGHGMQYLLLVGMLSAAPSDGSRPLVGVLVLTNVALVVGIALELASHLHDGDALARAVYGGYLGVLTAHFVIDAGLWRLRDAFPRSFLSQRVPFLLAP